MCRLNAAQTQEADQSHRKEADFRAYILGAHSNLFQFLVPPLLWGKPLLVKGSDCLMPAPVAECSGRTGHSHAN